MRRLQHHSNAVQDANAHNPGYVLGWRGGTNTCLAALRGLMDGGDWLLLEREMMDATIQLELPLVAAAELPPIPFGAAREREDQPGRSMDDLEPRS